MPTLPVERLTPMPARFRSNPEDPDKDVGELRLVALPSAVGCARHFALTQLRAWRLDRLVDACVLVTSELMTNSLKATGGLVAPRGYVDLHDRRLAPIVLRCRLTTRRLFVEVWDESHDPPIPTVAGADDEGGRGLLLVAGYSSAWNWYPSVIGGKVVWACWDLPPGRTPR